MLASGQQRHDDAWAEESVKPGVTGAVLMLVRLEMCVVSRAQYHTCQNRQRLSNVARSDTWPGLLLVNQRTLLHSSPTNETAGRVAVCYDCMHAHGRQQVGEDLARVVCMYIGMDCADMSALGKLPHFSWRNMWAAT